MHDGGEALPAPTRARPPPGQHCKTLVQGILRLAQRHSAWQVFSDFVEVSAIAMSNAVDRGQRETRQLGYSTCVPAEIPSSWGRPVRPSVTTSRQSRAILRRRAGASTGGPGGSQSSRSPAGEIRTARMMEL